MIRAKSKAMVTVAVALALVAIFLFAVDLGAHGVAEGDRGFIERNPGIQIVPFAYLGAKHMVTGYDHILFLIGVIFFSTA